MTSDASLDLAWPADLTRRCPANFISFEPPLASPIGNPAGEFGVADLNADGHLDLLFWDVDPAWPLLPEHIVLKALLGEGNGRFAAGGVTLAAKDTVFLLRPLRDIDGDGLPDIIGLLASDSSPFIAVGVGDGTFHASAPVALPLHSLSEFGVTDFNGDGNPDLIAMTDFRSKEGPLLEVIRNLGERRFSLQSSSGLSASQQLLRISERKFGGLPDAITAGGAEMFFFGGGGQSFSMPELIRASSLQEVLLLDLDLDGNDDLLLAGPTALTLVPGRFDGTFEEPRIAYRYSREERRRWIVSADFDCDGSQEIGLAERNGFGEWSIVILKPSKHALPFDIVARISIAGEPLFLDAADVDADDRPDLVFLRALSPASGAIAVLLNSSS